jgi:hypothetical protein
MRGGYDVDWGAMRSGSPQAVELCQGPSFDGSLDPFFYGLSVADQKFVRNVNDLDPVPPQRGGTIQFIVNHPLRTVMLAVQLDAKSQVGAIEIEDMAADWYLASELASAESAIA